MGTKINILKAVNTTLTHIKGVLAQSPSPRGIRKAAVASQLWEQTNGIKCEETITKKVSSPLFVGPAGC